MIEPMHNDSEVKLEVKPINSVGQAREFKYSIPTYNLLKIITICLTIILLSIIERMNSSQFKRDRFNPAFVQGFFKDYY